jgi:hypothetical protein
MYCVICSHVNELWLFERGAEREVKFEAAVWSNAPSYGSIERIS